MNRKVAIVGSRQTPHASDCGVSRERLVFDMMKGFYDDMGITPGDVGTFVLCCNDFQDGRTISEVFMVPRTGAYMHDQSKVDSDGASALLYALMRILSGSYDTAVVIAYGLGGSEFSGPSVLHHTLDPVYERQRGLVNDVSAAALQAKTYMDRHGLTEAQLARIAAKSLRNAALNPLALRRMPGASEQDVLASRPLYSPLHELHTYPPTDGACVVMLAADEKAEALTDRPVWVRGVGSCQETYYLGDRDLGVSTSLRLAGEKAYAMAGIRAPEKEVSFAELHTSFASQEPIFAEALGLFPAGSGGAVIDAGESEIHGRLPLNPSGGPLGANAFTACGLVRVAEAARQLRGEAGAHQVPDPRIGVAQGQIGLCAQHNTVFVLGTSR